MNLRDQWTFLPPQPKIARGMSRVVKMPLSVSLTVESAKPIDEAPRTFAGIPDGSEVWGVKGKLDVFPIMGTSTPLQALFYLPPRGNRLFVTDIKSPEMGRCGVVIVRALDHLLEQEGTKLTKLF